MKRTLFGLFIVCLPFMSFAQCYQGYKKEGDRLNRQAIYEKAIKQYLAAFTCPELQQQERNELIKLIDGALKARVKQLEDANKKTQQALKRATKAEKEANQALADLQNATQSILDNILKSAEEDILNLNYKAALAKIQNAAQLKVDDKKVGLAMMELVYFFNESGQHQKSN
jgi:vacuolar-type H+-ATPase subunit H